MFVYIYEVMVSLFGKEPNITHALVYAVCVQDAEALLGRTEGVLDYEREPLAVFSQPDYIEPQVILERLHRSQKGEYHG